MTTWTHVNLPWKHKDPPNYPEAPFTDEMRSWCGGMTYGEFSDSIYENNEEVYKREGLNSLTQGAWERLSETARAEIVANDTRLGDVIERIAATPERQAYSVLCQKLDEEHEATQFINKLEVGMLIELTSGRRLLVGDLNQEGHLGGCCPQNIPSDEIVVRYTKIPLPET